MTSAWTAAHVASLAPGAWPEAPLIDAACCRPVVPGHWLWDFWPAQDDAGDVVTIEGGELWFSLSAPHSSDPLDRHGAARIRAFHRQGGHWRDLGNAMPDGWSPGSREWSGSAVVRGDRLTLWFTAAGRRGEPVLSFEQRLFETHAILTPGILTPGIVTPGILTSGPGFAHWTMPAELVASDGGWYDFARDMVGSIGTIKAFRDPAWFRDPLDGTEYLLFTASVARSAFSHNGAVGIAVLHDDQWRLLPPLVTAEGVNNELERPHIVVIGGRYHLFWSTQSIVFAPGLTAPTGLYGMVAQRMAGPWQPIAGSGLVLANPADAPAQAYSWLVASDRSISSFVDVLPGHGFMGLPAPVLKID